MKTRFLSLFLCLGLAILGTTRAGAEEDENFVVKMIRDCTNTPFDTCIKSISATTSSGEVIKALLTGRTVADFGSGDAVIDDEYRLPGLKFEGSSGSNFVARVFFHPNWIQTGVEPSWIDYNKGETRELMILTPHRETSNWCGTTTSPFPCQRSYHFDQPLVFTETLRIPSEMEPSFVNGYTDLLTYSVARNTEKIEGRDYSEVTIQMRTSKRQSVLFSNLLTDPLASSDYADYESDTAGVNLFSAQDINSKALGKCSGIPFLSVISNGLNPEVPKWDAQSQSMSVQLTGPHFKVNGEVNIGFFQAVISGDIAKCLWGLDLSGQTKAQITIVDNKDEQNPVVETISGIFDGHAYTLTDSNFHFSSPKLSLKLFNEQPVKIVTDMNLGKPKVDVALGAKQKSIISCVKGKMIRRVSGIKPKCPSGYVQKK